MYKPRRAVARSAPKVSEPEDNMPIFCSNISTGEDQEFEDVASAAEAFDLEMGDIHEALYNGKPLMGHTWGWLM